MKNHYLIPAAVLFALAVSGCDKRSAEIDKRIAELERKNNEAVERQRELERQIEDQKLAAERDAIERERASIEEERAELERRQGQAAAEQDEALRQREEALSKREDKLDRVQETLEEKQDRLKGREQELTERDRDLAGREALDFEATEQNVPVGDYGTFYDGLSSYGSWFETTDYGYVWQPAVVREAGWRPYCRGRWVCTDRGWTWVSDEPFGWATYHYGRWALIMGRGWVWVPGTQWAPCWVSWRESHSHIGWAPLPPETMAYRGCDWDSTVDVRFGIAVNCYNFVEIRHFGSPLFRHCLPTAANFGWFNKTTNITYVHHQNDYVICGGPRYQRISERIGRPLPFYRLEVDQHPRASRDQLGMRPQVREGKLRIAAPNLDAGWNEGLRPKQVRGKIEAVKVERSGELSREITDRYRQNRDENRQKADRSIAELGGPVRFEEQRSERLQINRREVEGKLPANETRDTARKPEISRTESVENGNGPKVTPPPRNPSSSGPNVTPPPPIPGRPGNGNRDGGSGQTKTDPRMPDTKESRPVAGQGSGPNVVPEPPARRPETAGQSNGGGNGRQPDQGQDSGKENANRRQQEQAQRQAEQARQEQQENQRQKQQEQAKIRQEQETQRQEEQAKEARKQAMEEQREKARQQEQAREESRRQQQEQQQREMQRQQQEEARQRQQEEARQREQEQDRQRRQEEAREQQQREQARQREQEESRQRQQEQARQQQEEQSRQQKQRDDDDQRKRNR